MVKEKKSGKRGNSIMSHNHVFLLVLGIIAAGIVFFVITNLQISEPETETPGTVVDTDKDYIEMTGLEIAEKNLEFIESMRKDDGGYYYIQTCGGEKKESYIQSNAWALMAYASLYSATNDEAYKSAFENEFDIVLSNKKEDPQYTMWLSTQIDEAYEATKEDDYFDFVYRAGDHLLSLVSPNSVKDSMTAALASRTTALAARRLQENNYLPELKLKLIELSEKYLVRAKELISQESSIAKRKDNKFNMGSCWVQSAKLELFKTTGEKFHVNEINNYFDQMKLVSLLSDQEIFDKTNPTAIQPCIEVMLELSRKNLGSYEDDAKELLNKYLLKNWDNEINPICQGSNGYILTSKDKRMTLTESAYFTYLFSNFEIRSSNFNVGKK
ncbi:hypothetical protein GF327_10445 [Candidatus Woesearchaeota archaeon]|nr:hypothetical protein [Candidatus Woesearchaeota archaeon]